MVLFDDVVTTGNTMLAFKSELNSIGAKVLCCLSLGKTSHEVGPQSRPHPWLKEIGEKYQI